MALNSLVSNKMNRLRVAIIGRSELLYETALRLRDEGHEVTCIITAKEAPEYSRTSEDYRKLASAWQVPFAQGARIAEFASFLRDSRSDVAVSINYTGVVPQSVIDIFPLGVLNAHGGDLPRYRGNACQSWAILNGERRIGLCIHRMVGGELDSGDIIARDYLPIHQDTNITEVWRWMTECIPSLMSVAVNVLSVNPNYVLEIQSKAPEDSMRCYPRRPEDGRIEWRIPAISILRLINASSVPYSGAFCEFGGNKLIIWSAELVSDGENFCAVPGQVLKIGEGWIDVGCFDGKLRLLSVEINNQKGTPDMFIKSIRTRLC